MSNVLALGFLFLTPPADADLISARLYFRDINSPDNLGGPLTYSDHYVPIDIANIVPNDSNPEFAQTHKFDLSSVDWNIDGIPSDSVLTIGIAFLDDAGGIGDISSPEVQIPFDLTAPGQVTDLAYLPRSQ